VLVTALRQCVRRGLSIDVIAGSLNDSAMRAVNAEEEHANRASVFGRLAENQSKNTF